MKKIILPLILILIAGISIFSYRKRHEKLEDFIYAIGKEYIYMNNNTKTDITLSFTDNGFFGFGGVNRYFAGYKIDKNQIKFSPIGSTMMAGPEDKMQLEREYFDLMNTVNKVEVYKNKIILYTENNNKLKFILNKNYIDDEQEIIEEGNDANVTGIQQNN